MSSWYDEKPSKEFRDRVEHRAFQMIENRQHESRAISRRKSWLSMFQIAAGLSAATLVGILLVRRNPLQREEISSPPLAQSDLVSDSLPMDLLDVAAETKQELASLDLDFFSELEMLESFDEISDLSEDDLAEERA
jgi:hypothetical protein